MKHVSALTLALFIAASAAARAQEIEGKYANFTVPGAATSIPAGSYLIPGTMVQDMNDAGEIVGYYTANSSVPTRGFKRDPNGVITLLDDPGAGTAVAGGTPTFANTTPSSINDAGIIVGSFGTSVPVTESFFLTPQGVLSNFFAPAGSYYTQAISINSKGVITGRAGISQPNYIGLTTAFILEPNGQVTTFQAPDAFTTGYLNGTTSLGINSFNATTGWYYDAAQVVHSFVRAPGGSITEFSAPGASSLPYHGTWPIMIDDTGTVAGFYEDDNYGTHGYLRKPDGSFTQVNLPDPARNNQVFVEWINRSGDMTGSYTDASGVFHTWVRLRNGRFVYFTDPAAGSGSGQGTVPLRLNSAGEVAGYYIDSSNVYHGFVWKLDE